VSVKLVKGERVNLNKEAPGLKKIIIGLGWDPNNTNTGYDYDLDASAFVLGTNGKVLGDEWFIFYNQLESPDKAILHTGDNLTGDGDGDDEEIIVDLNKIDIKVERIVFTVTIHEAVERGQNFGQITNSYIRILDANTNKEILKYELDEDYSTETAINFGELYKKGNEWRFKAVGNGFNNGLIDFCRNYGVNV
jgi:tellurium resistance protein TerD